MPHDHGHHHGHAHGHGAAPNMNGAFALAIALNLGFTGVEFVYGFLAHSSALMADAGHNLSDVLGLVMAWVGALLARRVPDNRFTYGLRGSSILAALGNGMFLMIACGAIGWDAVRRLMDPPEVASVTVMVVAAIGVLINTVSAWLFVKGSKEDLNLRGAFLHLAADAAVSVGVVLAGLAILYTGWNWLDPVVSLVITVVIVAGTWGLLRDSLKLALNGVPDNVDLPEVDAWLRDREGVLDIHDLHIWGMSTTETALTVHLVIPDGHPGDAWLDRLAGDLQSHFGIDHSTLQVERGDSEHVCVLHGHAH
ncbi:cation diffusion facilitator family transporter [Alcanivorax sp. 521-1]|uniref:Cation diffusion facilitator family transporter n=1 Tax=Alloalcanivorax profundimaris TaxID=2735259 RepID=A0ABS0ASC5_9GAMM|nr:cation diffusion facilitator family transporter [Alloalcanivorax profundimaris]MBF5057023.1 cation diffusion facilitator family transporter [Alloalcanivorax profundimaris]